MTRQDRMCFATVAALFGLLGGALSQRMFATAVFAQDQKPAEAVRPPKLLAAEQFQLVDATGKVLAKLAAEGGSGALSLSGAGNAKVSASGGQGAIIITDASGKTIWRTVAFSAK